MIVLDTNIILDLLGRNDDAEALWSRSIYRSLAVQDAFACNVIIVAELAARTGSRTALMDELELMRLPVQELPLDAAFAAGRVHAQYRRRGGAREAILADFLIAGHAEAIGATLVTRDRRLASYFPNLTLITPETHPHG